MSLKDIPQNFDIDSEEDLRFVIANFFLELGFDANEISFEDSFSIQLGHNSIVVGKDPNRNTSGGRSDILVTRNGMPLIILEIKRPDHTLTEEDAQQAISYARLTDQITPFALLTNGSDTKVFDVLESSITEINSPEDSHWTKNGQRFSGLFDELKIEAARHLIGISSEILAQFCQKQVSSELQSLKSDVSGNKKFIPEIYVERIDLGNSFKSWLDSDQLIFTVVSPSGYGKTNFMCAAAERELDNNFVLFYSAKNLKDDIYSAIINDFIWEFQRSKNIAHIFQRFNSISTKHDKKLLIFIDGLDEYSNQLKNLKNELIEICKRLPAYPNIRFVFSCKTFDWPNFIIDNNQSYNLLAETITPNIKNSNLIEFEVNPKNVGIHLDEFTSAEHEIAIERYRSAYQLNGEFRGDVKQESANPLMLRFISEVYGKTGEKIPEDISSIELYEKYLKRKLSDVDSLNQSVILLNKITELIFSLDERFLNQNFLFEEINWNNEYDQALKDLIRLGILSQSIDDNGIKYIGFEFHKFLLFYYIFKEIHISDLSLSKRQEKIITLLQTKIGKEATEFYLLVGNPQEISETLIEICDLNFPVFVSLVNSFSSLKNYHKEPITFESIKAFLDTYNSLREKTFPKLKNLIMPESNGQLGVILIDKTPMLFRGTTQSYPEQFIEIQDKDIISQVVKGPASPVVLKELNPVGMFYIGGIHEFSKFPPLAAYNFFLKELSNTISQKCLSEENLQDILYERAYDLLAYHPSGWVKNDIFPPGKNYFELFGFETLEHLKEVKIQDIIVETEKYLNIVASEFSKPENKHSKNMKFEELISLLFILKGLPPDLTLIPPKIELDVLFKYLDVQKIEEAIPVVILLYPNIIKNFKALFEANFENLSAYSPLYKNLDKLSFIEIVWPNDHFGTDFLTLSYGFSENELSIEKPIIYTTDYSESKTRELHTENLFGASRFQSDRGSGYIILDKGEFNFIDEPARFWISKTTFPSRQPIQDQVYQLTNNELKLLLMPDHFTWGSDHMSGSGVNELYVRKCIKSLFINPLPSS